MLEISDGLPQPVKHLSITRMLGDGTGYLHLQAGQVFYVDFEPYLAVRSSPPVNFRVDAGSEVWLSQDFRVVGHATPAFVLDGHMTGVYNLTVAESRQVTVNESTSNSRYVNGEYVTSPPGK